MMDHQRAGRGKGPPPGEYVVRHERPYPERLDRAFRIGAAVVGCTALIMGCMVTAYGLYATGDTAGGTAAFALGAVFAATAYAAVRAVGLITTGVITGLRRKTYVVDYEERS